MKRYYIEVYYGRDGCGKERWIEVNRFLSINEAHRRTDRDRARNLGFGFKHWQVVEEGTDLTTLPPP